MGTTQTRGRKRILPVPAIALAASLAGCGGGGDSGGAVAGNLAFAVKWEKPGGGAQGFEDPIPPSVGAIRIVFDSDVGPPCCVAVLRGSDAFEERHLILTNTPVGDATVEVFGFPTSFAPNDGIGLTCPTGSPGGSPCSNNDTLPSFGSDETPVDVQASVTNRVDVDVYSLPFLINFNIEPGEEIEPDEPIRFTVVDANFPINPEIGVTIEGNPLAIDSSEPCEDGSTTLPDCSDDGELEVFGRIIRAHLDVFDLSGNSELVITASNTGSPPRDMESVTPIVLAGAQTTTTTSTTTTTTSSTTTTTLGELETFCLRFNLQTATDLIGISFNVGYSASGGDFVGSGENVECTNLLPSNDGTTLSSFNDDDEVQLSAAFISVEPFSGPTGLARCVFRQLPPLELGDFSIQVTEATDPDLNSVSAAVNVEEVSCPD